MRREGSGSSPLGEAGVIDRYFLDNRTRVLEVAAFLDRLDRARGGGGPADFRMRAFEQALRVLTAPGDRRVEQIQLIFSDPTHDPLPALDQKSARGAYQPQPEEVT
jgi:hypothetical protein